MSPIYVGVGSEPLWPINRLRYWNGEYLTAADFVDEQSYHLVDMSWRAALLRLAGATDGLGVGVVSGFQIDVQPGSAFDVNGALIVLAASSGANPPLAPLSAVGAASSWQLSSSGDGSWTRSFVPAEYTGFGSYALYIQYGETVIAGSGTPPRVNNIQQTPVIDITKPTALPPGAIVLAMLAVSESGFTPTYSNADAARAPVGVVVPAPLLALPPSSSSSSSSSGGEPAPPSQTYYLRSAPPPPVLAQLQIGGANGIRFGSLSKDGQGVDPSQATLSIAADGAATLSASSLDVNGDTIAVGALSIGPVGAPILQADAAGVTVVGSFAAGSGPSLSVANQAVTIAKPLTLTNAVTWAAPKGPITAVAPLCLLQQAAPNPALGFGSPGDGDDIIAWQPASSTLAVAGSQGVVLSVAETVALAVTPGPTTNVYAPKVTLGSLSAAGPITLSAAGGNLTFPTTGSQIVSNQWVAATLPFTSWTYTTLSTSNSVSFNSHGGTLLLTLSGALPATLDSTVGVPLLLYIDGAVALTLTPMQSALVPYSATVQPFWFVQPTQLVLPATLGTKAHTAYVTIADKIDTTLQWALTLTLLEQPLANS